MFGLREYQGVPFKPPNETLSWNQNSCFFSWGEVAATRAGKPQPHVPLWPLSQSWRRKKQREASKIVPPCSGLLPVLTWGEPQSRYMTRQITRMACLFLIGNSSSSVEEGQPIIWSNKPEQPLSAEAPHVAEQGTRLVLYQFLKPLNIFIIGPPSAEDLPCFCSQEYLWCNFNQWFWLESFWKLWSCMLLAHP